MIFSPNNSLFCPVKMWIIYDIYLSNSLDIGKLQLPWVNVAGTSPTFHMLAQTDPQPSLQVLAVSSYDLASWRGRKVPG